MELCLDGLTDLPAGKIASVVTSLEMHEAPQGAGAKARDDLELRHVPDPDVAWYRALYGRIGTDWLWFSRQQLDDAALHGIITDPATDVYVLRHEGADAGLVEIDRRSAPDIELAFFGLVPELVGKGAGGWMMARALEIAWSHNPRRLWVHTCTLDHPGALGFYIRSGFAPYRRSIEVVDDPRLTGTLPRDAGGHVPII